MDKIIYALNNHLIEINEDFLRRMLGNYEYIKQVLDYSIDLIDVKCILEDEDIYKNMKILLQNLKNINKYQELYKIKNKLKILSKIFIVLIENKLEIADDEIDKDKKKYITFIRVRKILRNYPYLKIY